MSKKDQLWVNQYDFSEPKALERLFKGRFNAGRADVLKYIGDSSDLDIDKKRYQKRLDTAYQTVYTAKEMIGEDYPDFPGTSYFEDDWAYLNSLIITGYDAINEKSDLMMGASIWILDTLYNHRLLYQAENEILPKFSEAVFDELEEALTCNDFLFSNVIIAKVKYVLIHRNDDCNVYRPKEKIKRTILDEATIRGKQHQDVPSRVTYEKLIDLIPQEEVDKAVEAFRTKYWELARNFFAGLKENHAVRDRQMKLHDKVYLNSPNPLKEIKVTLMNGELNAIDKNKLKEYKEIREALYRCADIVSEKEEQKEDMAEGLFEFMRIPAKIRKEIYSNEFLERMKSFRIENPYQLCFALVYLADHDDDLIWLYFFGTALVAMAADTLPWRLEWDEFNTIDLQAEEEKAGTMTPKNVTDLYEVKYESKEIDTFFREPYNLAQLMYEHTGTILPRDLNTFGWAERIWNEYGISEEDQKLMRICMAMMDDLTHRYDGEFAAEEKEPDVVIRDENNLQEECVLLKQQMILLQKENKFLQEKAWQSQSEVKRLSGKIEKMMQEVKSEREELAGLREVTFVNREKQEEKENPDIQLPYETKHSILVCGGHDSFIKQFSRMITGKVRFVNNVRINENLIRNIDVVWFQTNAISHSEYYTVTDLCRKYGKPMRYFLYASARKCAEQVVKTDKEMIEKS